MELHVTLVSAPPSAIPAREIVVDTHVLSTGSALAERLESGGYRGPFSVDGIPLSGLVPHTGVLIDGAIVVSGEARRAKENRTSSHLVLVVHSGPDAGQVFPLSRGAYTVGRAASDIAIADPGLSRHHALLTVTEDAILLEDLGSANGTFVDGESITSTTVTISATVQLGASSLRIELLDDSDWEATAPRELLAALPVDAEVPRKPSRILILTALLPLVLGVVLALTTGMWFFLAFSALSAMTGLVPLLAYRRSERAFAGAVDRVAEQDRLRRVHGVPNPGRMAVAALRACHATAPPLRGREASPDVLLLRLGTADQPANVTVRRDEGAFTPPTLLNVPLVLVCDLRSGATSARSCLISGEAEAARNLVRAMLLQLGHGGAPPVVIWGSSREVPLQARFLPNVLLTRDPRSLASIIEQSAICVVFQFTDDLPDVSGTAGVFLIRITTGQATTTGGVAPVIGTGAGARVTLHADPAAARVCIDGRELEAVLDGVSDGTFDRTARALARVGASNEGRRSGLRPNTRSQSDGPPPCAFVLPPDFTPDALTACASARWRSSDPSRATAHLGESGVGPVSIDLVGDGPHLLVAGTTGSGKSEFLRTLVLGLAVNQPPEHLTLLLIDYKGGSGLGALASLPHCVGSLSDLSSESTARALVSLRAELRRREHLCAEHGAHDLGELRRVVASACPPRLVVVIDEFRALSDEVPTAVPDLMKIGALGRSLGVHLVLATQRPQGAVAPDMRANITSSVLLRVQTPMESQDLLGSSLAAEIPVGTPGRAFLRRGAEAPVSFQVASSSAVPAASTTRGWQDISAYLAGDPEDPTVEPRRAAGQASHAAGSATPGHRADQDVLHRAVVAVALAARTSGARRPIRPVLPPLAAVLPSAACLDFLPADAERSSASALGPAPARGGVALGLADFPEHQQQRLLQWRPRDHSHLALVGLPGCGGSAALGSVVSALPAADPDIHLYLLDGDGALKNVPRDGRLGAYVPSHETKRAGRVLERLAALPSRIPGDAPPIVLAISGWGRWTSQFRNGRSSRAEEDLHSIVRDGAHNGVSIVIAGDRELTSSRFFPLVPNRIFLPLGAHQETTMTWPKMPSLDSVPGRGLAQGPVTGSWGEGVCQLVLEPTRAPAPVRPPARSPFMVHPLPESVPLQQLLSSGDGRRQDTLTLGVQGDDLGPYRITLEPGESYFVLGHRASGRSNALRVIAETAALLLPRRDVLVAPTGTDVAEYWRRLAKQCSDAGALDRCLVIVDDADQLPADVQQILSGLVARGAAAALAAAPSPALMARVPLALQARNNGSGFVLSPRSTADGDIFGARLEPDGPPIPGRGYACTSTGILEVQLAHAQDGSSDRGAEARRGEAPGPTALSGPTAFFRSR